MVSANLSGSAVYWIRKAAGRAQNDSSGYHVFWLINGLIKTSIKVRFLYLEDEPRISYVIFWLRSIFENEQSNKFEIRIIYLQISLSKHPTVFLP